jgi:replicative DNA helicase
MNEPTGQDRLPPQSIQAERCVLGSMMLDPFAIAQAMQILKKGHFFREAHQTLFAVLVELYDDRGGKGIDLVTIRDYLEKRQLFEAIGGEAALVDIVNAVPVADHVEYYARIVREKHLLRTLVQMGSQVIREAMSETENAAAALERCQQVVLDLVHEATGATKSADFATLLSNAYEKIANGDGSHITGLSTGLAELDTITRGLQPSELILIAARPSIGKTGLALNIAEHLAVDEKIPVAFFSLEMSGQLLAKRILAGRADVPGDRLDRGLLNDAEFGRLAAALGPLSEASLHIDDSPSLTIMQLRARARRLQHLHGIRCVFVDYLQLLDSPYQGRDVNRQQQIAEISKGLKSLARELNIPVVAMSQLNRGPEARETQGFRPRISDLRESGSLEQDADVVILLHREEHYYVGQDAPEDIRGIAEAIVAKQRNGPTGMVRLQFKKETVRFRNLTFGATDF